MTQLQALLNQIFEAYHDYVNTELMFDSPAHEIVEFDLWAHLHYGVSRQEAQDFFYAKAA